MSFHEDSIAAPTHIVGLWLPRLLAQVYKTKAQREALRDQMHGQGRGEQAIKAALESLNMRQQVQGRATSYGLGQRFDAVGGLDEHFVEFFICITAVSCWGKSVILH
jgi:hypothetical protein